MQVVYAFLLMQLLSLSSVLSAQTITVNGKVLNESGEPAKGITVSVQGMKSVTATDSIGNFSIDVPKLPAVLILTGVGYERSEFTVTRNNISMPIEVRLRASGEALAEVVVVGYGTASKREITLERPKVTTEGVTGSVRGLAITKSSAKSPGPDRPILRTSTGSIPATDHPKSKILTAGELSDFKKWKLWGDYSESEFKTWSTHWDIAFQKRYCVQVQNIDHKPVVGENVYLVNNHTKDTLWHAVTDNTGKAELWASKYKDDQTVYSIVCGSQWLHAPTIFEKGINRITLKRTCALSSIADIAFVVDATGSMGDEIAYLQAELQDIISKTSDQHKEVTLRISSVFYRDRGDEYLTRHIDFQTDPAILTSFLKKQSAQGGGDRPEAVEDALTTALDSLSWQGAARTKILFLVLDAPPHDAAKNKMKELIRKAAGKGIRIVPIACSGVDKSDEYLMRCAALATNGSYVFLTDDSGVGNPHIKPTTDEFKVELLNDLLLRLIGEMIYVPACEKNEDRLVVVNVPEHTDKEVIVYPNPTQGRVQITAKSLIKEVMITDFTGKVLMRQTFSNKRGKWDIDLNQYPSGTYLVKYYKEDKGWGAEKVLLMR
jgi:hypothetical protein